MTDVRRYAAFSDDPRAHVPVRYFAAEVEVDFCGHATIATDVAIGEVTGQGTYTLATNVGPVQITARRDGERAVGSLRSPEVGCLPLEPGLLAPLLAAWGGHLMISTPAYPRRSASGATGIQCSSCATSVGWPPWRTTSRACSGFAVSTTG